MTFARATLALATGAVLAACSGPAQTAPASPAPGAAGQPAMPAAGGVAPPDPAAIFARYQADPGFVKITSAPIKSGPHLGDVDYYVDKANAATFKDTGAAAPDGLTVVKVSLRDPKRAYLMQKIKGYDPANNDWYYANTRADGTLDMTGKPQLCISCHAGYKATDYLGAPAIDGAKAMLK